MNKLFGFYELKDLPIPSVNWKEFKSGTVLNDSKLWVIRSAVLSGDDMSLPRMVGKPAKECMKYAESLLRNYRGKLFVLYYPFFGAVKSGTMLVGKDTTVIEAVYKDLWNLVDLHKLDYSAKVLKSGNVRVNSGEIDFFTKSELNNLIKCADKVRTYFNKAIRANELVLLEWSFGRDVDANGEEVGEPYLIFYEARTVGGNPVNNLF